MVTRTFCSGTSPVFTTRDRNSAVSPVAYRSLPTRVTVNAGVGGTGVDHRHATLRRRTLSAVGGGSNVDTAASGLGGHEFHGHQPRIARLQRAVLFRFIDFFGASYLMHHLAVALGKQMQILQRL